MPTKLPSDADEKILAYIETMRRRLIDQSGRNRLINFRATARSSIQLLYADSSHIWQRLVSEERPWKLIPGCLRELTENEGNEDPQSAKSRKKTQLRFLPKEDICSSAQRGQLAVKLDHTQLRSIGTLIRRKATAVIEETGINHLYLSIGFLKWYESEDSEIERISPLLLIPITLKSTPPPSGELEAGLEIEHDGSDIEPNISLNLTLEERFNISLPFIDEDEVVNDYLSRVKRAISRKKNWEIVNDAFLAFFSFAKLRMYQDLNPDVWPQGQRLESNELVRAMLVGSEQMDDNPYYGEVEIHDEHEAAHEIPLVVDADSSQHTAILKVFEGKNTVIEGPPGTGKSQTITNIIASAIASGKTVLFVSEKLAALNVVKSNLDSIGLGDFCLELHSNKAGKGQVHHSIEQRTKQHFPMPH